MHTIQLCREEQSFQCSVSITLDFHYIIFKWDTVYHKSGNFNSKNVFVVWANTKIKIVNTLSHQILISTNLHVYMAVNTFHLCGLAPLDRKSKQICGILLGKCLIIDQICLFFTYTVLFYTWVLSWQLLPKSPCTHGICEHNMAFQPFYSPSFLCMLLIILSVVTEAGK